jgi:type IV pilus assembly protein PilW
MMIALRSALPRPIGQQGFSLIEIMVAMTIGLVLMGGLVQIFISNKQTYRVQEAMARLQENGRFALDLITNDLRASGFRGCNARRTMESYNRLNGAAGSLLWDYDFPLQGFEATSSSAWTPALTSTPFSGALGGRDVITIRHGIGSPLLLAEDVSPSTADVKVLRPSGLVAGNIVVVSNCNNASVFQVTGITANTGSTPPTDSLAHAASGTPGNASNDLLQVFRTNLSNVEATQVATSTYFINTGAAGVPSLFLDRRDGVNATAQEVVEGVQDMQVLYGLDTDTATDDYKDRVPNRYVTADNVVTGSTNWSHVVSIKIDLLLQSTENNLADSPQTYTFNGTTTTPGTSDKRLRRVFSATVDLRNRSR